MLTKGAIGNLINRYKAVLTKCNLINTFGSLAVASMLVLGGAGVAEAGVVEKDGILLGTYTGNTSNEYGDAGVATFNYDYTTENELSIADETKFESNTKTNGAAGAVKILNGINIGKNVEFTKNKAGTIGQNDEAWGGGALYIKTVNNMEETEKQTIAIGTGAKFTDNEAREHGGAIALEYGLLNIGDGATFTENKAGVSGGAIAVWHDTTNGEYNSEDPGTALVLNNATFTTNSAKHGGAIATSTMTTINGGSFVNNSATGWGGAINNSGVLVVNGAMFNGNTAGVTGGAIGMSTDGDNASVKVENSTFKNNHAKYDGGAIGSFRTLEISGSTFEGNTAQLGGDNFDEVVTDDTAIGGGAIALGAVSNTSIASITDTVFKNNVSGYNGGAIATRMAKDADNSAAKLDIAATFIGNEAKKSGGAFYNTFYTSNGLDKGDGVTVTGVFEGNKAGENGGAIYNDGTMDKASSPNGGIMTITDSTFTGNSAKGRGGAIYNSGTLTLNGNNVFSDNTANGVANDIHNDGILTINGTASLAGGITGEGKLVAGEDAALTITDAAAKIEQKEVEGSFTATATGDVTDQTGGDIEAMQAQLGNGVKLTKMEEGLISGEVIKSGDKIIKKTSTVLKDTLEQATAAPLAVNRILMNDVRKRMGDLRDTKEDSGVWMRWDGGKLKGDEGLTNNFNTIQIGADMLTGIKNVRAGVAGSFTHGDVDHNNGDGEMEAYTFAAYGTWMADNGMFADVIARVGFNNTELNIKGGKADLDNEALSLSAEYGWRFDLGQQFFVEPQAELTYTHVTGADFTIKTASYDVDSVDSLLGRAGLAAGWKLPNERGNVYARASVVHEFLGDAEITGTNKGNSIPYELDGDDTWLEYGIGANVKLTDSTYVWADVERTEGAEIEEEWRGTVGVRFSF